MITYKNTIPVEDYMNMRLAVGWRGLKESQASTGLQNSAYLTAAWEDSTPIGMARVISDGGYMTLIVDVMVLPEYQGRGIGKQLLTNINHWLDKQAGDDNCIMVNLMATLGNEGFYEKLGYERRPNDRMGGGMVRWING